MNRPFFFRLAAPSTGDSGWFISPRIRHFVPGATQTRHFRRSAPSDYRHHIFVRAAASFLVLRRAIG